MVLKLVVFAEVHLIWTKIRHPEHLKQKFSWGELPIDVSIFMVQKSTQYINIDKLVALRQAKTAEGKSMLYYWVNLVVNTLIQWYFL